MTFFRKYWYVIVFGLVIFLWILINPSVKTESEQVQENVSIDMQADPVEEDTEMEEEEITKMVDIKGEVVHPGVYEIREGDRVKDVIARAGGLTKEANSQSINMAERVYDEMVILIAGQEEGTAVQTAKTSDGKVRVNQATKEELMTISGIGEVKAAAIIEYRETNGRFKTVTDLTNVSGIGEKTVERIQDLIQIP
ncbi:hypothetical protein F9U64_17530 [Gracilibacillus oryzae]|uniref:Helix-hairpin-helix DNA-binding motif class 1 domain-containing protein n=1 Tax=Gracilibacillus oryzae TaxID=1672701 RepID=A0A7C8KWJ4_9BACI|nr:helix-hairpin-helix domain-containing protein [Gracilibacillus oryzae]KAB8127448.1 hypothetical protein F9U64_17530 [Gracilibacillus oryzae]